MKNNIPLLGICGGMQLMAVMAGCTLIQDLTSSGYPTHEQPDSKKNPFHTVELTPNSLIANAYQTTSIHTNSTHHQAVDGCSPHVRITGRSSDNVIEAIEIATHPFALGVQWHPEALDIPNAHAPYRALIAAVHSKAGGSFDE